MDVYQGNTALVELLLQLSPSQVKDKDDVSVQSLLCYVNNIFNLVVVIIVGCKHIIELAVFN